MDNMTICKKIAELEGYIVSDHQVGKTDVWVHICDHTNSSVTLYNPLTDDALNHQLMIKYEVAFEPSLFFVGRYSCYCRDEHQNKILPKTDDTSPNKAILLAIIEAHKENNHE